MTKDATKEHDLLELLSIEVGLRPGFLDALLHEPDHWAFVVKAHALLESVVCAWLTSHLAQPAIEPVLASKVEMRTRIALLKALGLGSQEQHRQMIVLGELRNQLAHSALGTEFRFDPYLDDKNRRRQFSADFNMSSNVASGKPDEPSIGDWAKLAVFHAVVGIVVETVTAKRKPTAQMYLDALLKLLRGETSQGRNG